MSEASNWPEIISADDMPQTLDGMFSPKEIAEDQLSIGRIMEAAETLNGPAPRLEPVKVGPLTKVERVRRMLHMRIRGIYYPGRIKD